MDDLEKDIKDALDELRAEFNRLEKKEAGEDEAGEDEAGEDEGDEGEMEMEDTFVAEEEEGPVLPVVEFRDPYRAAGRKPEIVLLVNRPRSLEVAPARRHRDHLGNDRASAIIDFSFQI